jgi:hypothetical protein
MPEATFEGTKDVTSKPDIGHAPGCQGHQAILHLLIDSVSDSTLSSEYGLSMSMSSSAPVCGRCCGLGGGLLGEAAQRAIWRFLWNLKVGSASAL